MITCFDGEPAGRDFPKRPNEPVVVIGAGPARQFSGALSGEDAERRGIVLRRPEELTIGMLADAITRDASEDATLPASVGLDLGRILTNA